MSRQLRRVFWLTGAGLVLLRIAIGWHFLYEGIYKFASRRPGELPFSAEPYLRYSTGPLKNVAARLLDDKDSLERLSWQGAKAWYEGEAGRFQDFYAFTDEQKEAAKNRIADGLEAMKKMFDSEEFQTRLEDYKRSLAGLKEAQANVRTQFDAERVAADQVYVEQTRINLLKMVEHWWDNRHQLGELRNMLTHEQLSKGALPPPTRTIDWVNSMVTWGLTIVGLGLILGLLTRLSCLGAAGFLAMFYLAYPPWPGLAAGAATEGHYLFVDRNLIELIAVLLLATTRSGHWVGLDALVSRLWGGRSARGGEAEPECATAAPDAEAC